jgi:iron uptake system component EfeO
VEPEHHLGSRSVRRPARCRPADAEDRAGRPGDPARGAGGGLRRADRGGVRGKITGEEDRYSGTDLWDFAANVEGSRRGFDL